MGLGEGGEVPEDQWLTRELREGSATAEKGRRRRNHPGERRRRRRTSRTISPLPGHPGSSSSARRDRGKRRSRGRGRLAPGRPASTAWCGMAAAEAGAQQGELGLGFDPEKEEGRGGERAGRLGGLFLHQGERGGGRVQGRMATAAWRTGRHCGDRNKTMTICKNPPGNL